MALCKRTKQPPTPCSGVQDVRLHYNLLIKTLFIKYMFYVQRKHTLDKKIKKLRLHFNQKCGSNLIYGSDKFQTGFLLAPGISRDENRVLDQSAASEPTASADTSTTTTSSSSETAREG